MGTHHADAGRSASDPTDRAHPVNRGTSPMCPHNGSMTTLLGDLLTEIDEIGVREYWNGRQGALAGRTSPRVDALGSRSAGNEQGGAMELRSRVLVVDGDTDFCVAFSEALRRAGYRAEQARTGEEALQAAGRQRPALVIIETHLPGTSGYEIVRELRERHGEGLPIIFVSAARTDETDRVAGLLLGADDYLTKPVRFDHLIARVAARGSVGAGRRAYR